MHGMYTVKMPHALMVSRPTHATYVRRRLVLLVFLAVMVFSFGLAARSGLADRGDGPASVSTAGRTSQVDALQGTPDGTYVVQPGDSLVKKSEDAPGNWRIKLVKVFLRQRGQLNCPCHSAS